MRHEALMALVDGYEAANHARDTQRQQVWNAIRVLEPGLADVLLELFSSPEAASQWLLKAPGSCQPCPARTIAEGRAAQVREKALRTLHGSAA